MHLVIASREDPSLPLARLRSQGQLTELRAADLRFTTAEAADFLNPAMGVHLSDDDVAALESRTEGWIAGLQLAAISLQGQQDAGAFIRDFTGSDHYVLDYLVEEVLQRQPERVQRFLLNTAVLDRMCGPLCDAVLQGNSGPTPSVSGQETLEYLACANVFIVPLDNERRWYRYHHLFRDLLRQRLHQSAAAVGLPGGGESLANELHLRASHWYEVNGLELEAFQQAAAANDIERAERLIEGKGMPLHVPGAASVILGWLESLPAKALNARPSLWWRYASLLLVTGHTAGVEEKLQAAESALRSQRGRGTDEKARNLIGEVATARAMSALTGHQVETMLAESQRALEYLASDKFSRRANANWTLGYAYLLQGEHVAARRALTDAIALSEECGDIFTAMLATIGLGNVEEAENRLHLAAQIYRRVLQQAGDQPLQIIGKAHLGLARVLYEWNDLDAAGHHGRWSLELAQQYDRVIDRLLISEVFLARLALARGDLNGAAAILAQANQSARQENFVHRVPDVAAALVQVLLRQGDLAAAAQLAQQHGPALSQARVHLVQRDTAAAVALLDRQGEQWKAKGWPDAQLKGLVLQAVAHHAHGEEDRALHLLEDALALGEPGGFIRTFLDEGLPMARLLSRALARGILPAYTAKLLAAFESEQPPGEAAPRPSAASPTQLPGDALSRRETEVLELMAQGLSNREITEKLFLALDTVKGHNRNIFRKLEAQSRTEAVAHARALDLL